MRRLWIAVIAAALPATSGAERSRDGRVVRIDKQVSEMVRVPAGVARLGATPGELESLKRACMQLYDARVHELTCEDQGFPAVLIGAQHTMFQGNARRVSLRSFAIDRHEVTTAEYRECVAGGACSAAPLLAGDETHLAPPLPMVNVTWQDAADYCRWRGKRLPTEDEWEKAARGTDGRRWPWGNQNRRDGANVGRAEDPGLTRSVTAAQRSRYPLPNFIGDRADGFAAAAAPGSLVWGASPYGAYDMAGNVREWVADYYRPDLVEPSRGSRARRSPPSILPNRYRVVRGGSWELPRLVARTYFRQYLDPLDRAADLGFRCARDL